MDESEILARLQAYQTLTANGDKEMDLKAIMYDLVCVVKGYQTAVPPQELRRVFLTQMEEIWDDVQVLRFPASEIQ